jgi:hypothetical protein
MNVVVQLLTDPALPAQVLAVLAGLMTVAHGLEWVASKTENKIDDEIVAKLVGVLDFVLKYLPRFGRGGK